MKNFIQGMYQKKHFARRLISVILAVIVMGFALSWLVLVNFGTDPCTSMNLAISGRLGMSLGNWQALLNCLLFIIVILWGREYIGFGTLANMFSSAIRLTFSRGYGQKYCRTGCLIPMAVRLGVLLPALAVFVVAAGVYMVTELGTAPYDAIPFLIVKAQKKVPFRVVRMVFDFTVIVIAWVFGAKIGLVTILMGFTLGPVISWVGEKMAPFFNE